MVINTNSQGVPIAATNINYVSTRAVDLEKNNISMSFSGMPNFGDISQNSDRFTISVNPLLVTTSGLYEVNIVLSDSL